VSFKSRFCLALSLLNLHDPDCKHCAVQNCMGIAMRRLKDLNEHAQRMCQQKTHGEDKKNDSDAA
jgi:hypothetical protein